MAKFIGIVSEPLSVDFFDDMDLPESIVYAAICMMGLKVGQKYTEDQLGILDEEHGFSSMAHHEIKEYILEYGPDFLRKGH